MTGPKPKSKVMADGRGRRIRHLPGGQEPREEGSALSGVARPKPREEETGSISSDHRNMRAGTFLSNAPNHMSAMRLAQVKGSAADQKSRAMPPAAAKEMAPARGDERGPLTARTTSSSGGEQAGAREEKHPPS